jgi:hypothetical protein
MGDPSRLKQCLRGPPANLLMAEVVVEQLLECVTSLVLPASTSTVNLAAWLSATRRLPSTVRES